MGREPGSHAVRPECDPTMKYKGQSVSAGTVPGERLGEAGL